MSAEKDSGADSANDSEMKNRFGGAEKSPEVKDTDDDDDEEDSKPSKSWFSSREKAETDDKSAEDKTEKIGLFGRFLKKEVEAVDPAVELAEVSAAAEVVEPTTGENESSAAEISEQQVGEAFEQTLETRIDDVARELELPTTIDDAVEAQADAEYLSRVGELLEEGEPPAEAIENALEDEITPPETDADQVDLATLENFEPEQVEVEEPAVIVPTPAVVSPLPPVQPRPPVQPPIQPGGPGSSNGPNNPNMPPQNPNVLPYQPYNPNVLYPIGGNQASTPNVLRTPSTVNSPDVTQMNEHYYRDGRKGGLLLGGAVGYMLGRRGGRQRTEARLEPVINKQEQEISELKTKLSESEVEVRSMAAERAKESAAAEMSSTEIKHEEIVYERAAEIPRVEEVIADKAETLAEEKARVERQQQQFAEAIENAPAELVETSPAEAVGSVLERSAAAELLHGAVDGIGKVVEKTTEALQDREPAYAAAEIAPIVIPTVEKQSEHKQERREHVEARKDPRTMTMPELLEASGNIFLEKTSLRQLYERNRIDAVNLRRVVIEYFQGGHSYERVLRGSLEAVEMQRELRNEVKLDDPTYRVPTDDGTTGSSSQQTALAGAAAGTESNSPESKYDTQSSRVSHATTPGVAEEERPLVSNGTAIALGILAGIVITILVLIYANFLG